MSATPQPRLSAADQLDRLTPRWDELVRRARLARSPADYNDVEEEAQALASDVVGAFRRRTTSVASPLRISPCGTKVLF